MALLKQVEALGVPRSQQGGRGRHEVGQPGAAVALVVGGTTSKAQLNVAAADRLLLKFA